MAACADGDELVPRLGRGLVDVVAVGHRLEVADRRQRDERRLLVLEALDARPGARRPVAQLEERLGEAGVADDAVLAEVLEDARRGELRDPRVVHDVDVVLPGLALPVLEGLRVERVVGRGQELDRDPGLLLEERDDLLEDVDRAVLERADHELPGVGAPCRLACAKAGVVPSSGTAASPAPAVSSRSRRLSALASRGAEPSGGISGVMRTSPFACLPGRSGGAPSFPPARRSTRSSGPRARRSASRSAPSNSRAARAITRWSPMRTSTSVSLPIGSTT